MRLSILGTWLLVLLAGFVGGSARYFYDSFGGVSGYATVVLSTDNVYFAKVSNMNSDYITLRDIYYPQVIQNEAGQSDVRLIKFGSEFHKPQDEIQVNREFVIMIQPLELDSPIITTIEDYENGAQGAETTPTPTE